MADPLTHLKQRSKDDWLLGYESQEFFGLAEQRLWEVRSHPSSQSPLTILLAERNPLKFLASFIAACAANCHVFLANPDWTDAEWQQVFEFVEPDLLWGAEARSQKPEARSQKAASTPRTPHPTPQILIPTGGTSGKIRFAIHTWETLMASVQGFRDYFEVEHVNSFCVLPLYHVSGLMQFLRSFTTGGQLVVLPFKAVEAGDRSFVNPENFFLSLVPTQLQRLLDRDNLVASVESVVGTQNSKPSSLSAHLRSGSQRASATQSSLACRRIYEVALKESVRLKPQTTSAWLSRFHTVLLGGAPAWADLLDHARTHRIRLAPTYGMTETASQIATLKPDDFLNGQTNAGQVLPHAQITIRSPSGKLLNSPHTGIITIQAASLAKGYYPSSLSDRNLSAHLHKTLESNEDHRSALTVTIKDPSKALSSPPKLSCSGGLGELGPQKAGGRGEVPRTQSLNEAAISTGQSLEQERAFQPDDIGFFDPNGYLHIVGRQSDKIITGGENVFPAEVEAAIRATDLVHDIYVIGVSDRQWGQAITAVYVPIHINIPTKTIQAALENKLCKFKRPKHWLAVAQLPRNAQGKVNRSHVEAIAKERLSSVPTSE